MTNNKNITNMNQVMKAEINQIWDKITELRADLIKMKETNNQLIAHNKHMELLHEKNYARLQDLATILGADHSSLHRSVPVQNNHFAYDGTQGMQMSEYESDHDSPPSKRRKLQPILPRPPYPVAFNENDTYSNVMEMRTRTDPVLYNKPLISCPAPPNPSPQNSPPQMPVTFPSPPAPLFTSCFDNENPTSGFDIEHYYDF